MTSTVKRALVTSQPIWIMRGTPTAVASSMTAWMSGGWLWPRGMWGGCGCRRPGRAERPGPGGGQNVQSCSLGLVAVGFRFEPLELFIDHRRVQRGEDRERLGDRSAHHDRV